MARINVIYTPTGEQGSIDEADFDPSKFQPVTPKAPAEPQKGMQEKIGDAVINVGEALAKPFIRTGQNIAGAGVEVLRSKALNALAPFERSTADNAVYDVLINQADRAEKSGDKKKAEQLRERAKTEYSKFGVAVDPHGESFQGLPSIPNVSGAIADIPNPFMGEEKLKEVSQPLSLEKGSPMRQQLADSATIASYAVPFGKAQQGAGILSRAATKYIAPGAATGALQSLGQAGERDVSTGEVVGSAVTGAGAGLAMGAANKVISGAARGGEVLEDAGGTIRQGVRQIRLKPKVGGAQDEAIVNKVLDDLGFKGTPQQQYEMLLPKMQELEGDIQSILAANPKQLNRQALVDKFMQNLDEPILSSRLNKQQAKETVNDILSQLIGDGETISSPEVFSAKQRVNGIYGRIADKVESNVPLTPQEEVLYAARKALDDSIAAVHPDVKGKTLAQSHLYDSAQSLSRARQNPPTLRVAGTSVPGAVSNRAIGAAGAGIEKTGQALSAFGRIPQIPAGIAVKGAEALINTNQYAPNAEGQYPQGGGQPAENGVQEQPQQNQEYTDQSTLSGDILPEKSQFITGYSPEQIYAGIQAATNAGDTKAAKQLRTLYEDETAYQKATGPKPMTEKQRMYANTANSAAYALKLLEEGQATTGASKSLFKGAKRMLGTETLPQQDLWSTLDIARAGLLNSLQGATITKEEWRRISSLLDIENSDPEIAKQQLRSLIRESARFSQGSAANSQIPEITQ